jgi:cobalt-zinc-cadmium efflux system membrane fusion protein
MFAALEVLTESTSEAVMAIPQSAVVEANGQPLVFVRNGNAFEPVEVTLGRTAGDQVEVLSGLFEGDEVVTQRANQLYAQSLRGGSAEATEETAAPVEAVATAGVPWWALGLGSGAIAVTTFAAGIWWARRQRPTYALAIGDEGVLPSAPGHPRYGAGPTLAAPLVEEGEPSRK